MSESFECALCQRHLKGRGSRHHLIPRACHRKPWFKKRFSREQMHVTIEVCGECHAAIHDLIPDERELGHSYHTVAELLTHPGIQKHLVWVRKQK